MIKVCFCELDEVFMFYIGLRYLRCVSNKNCLPPPRPKKNCGSRKTCFN